MSCRVKSIFVALMVSFLLSERLPAQERERYEISPVILAHSNKYGMAEGEHIALFNHDEKLAICSGKKLRIHKLASGALEGEWTLPVDHIYGLAISENDLVVAVRGFSGQDPKLVLFDLIVGEVASEQKIESNMVYSPGFAISRNADYAFVSDYSGKGMVYRTRDWEVVETLMMDGGSVSSAAFGVKSDRLALFGQNGSLLVYDKPGGKVIHKESRNFYDHMPVVQFLKSDELISIRANEDRWVDLSEKNGDLVSKLTRDSKQKRQIAHEKVKLEYEADRTQTKTKLRLFDARNDQLIVEKEWHSPLSRVIALSETGNFVHVRDVNGQNSIVNLKETESKPQLSFPVNHLLFLPGKNRVLAVGNYAAGLATEGSIENVSIPNYPYIQMVRIDEKNKRFFLLPYAGPTLMVGTFDDPLKIKMLAFPKSTKAMKLSRGGARHFDFRINDAGEATMVMTQISRSMFVPGVAKGEVVVAKVDIEGDRLLNFNRIEYSKLGPANESATRTVPTSGPASLFFSGERSYPEMNQVFSLIGENDQVILGMNRRLNSVGVADGRISATYESSEAEGQTRPLCFVPARQSVLFSRQGSQSLHEFKVENGEVSESLDFKVGACYSISLGSEKYGAALGNLGLAIFEPATMKLLGTVSGPIKSFAFSPDGEFMVLGATTGGLSIEKTEELLKKKKFELILK